MKSNMDSKIKEALRDIFDIVGTDLKYADYASVVIILERLVKKATKGEKR